MCGVQLERGRDQKLGNNRPNRQIRVDILVQRHQNRGGGVLVYPCRSPREPALTPPQRGSGCPRCSWAEVSGGQKKGGRAKTQKFVFVYTLGLRLLVRCGLKARLQIFLRFVLTPRLEKVISGKPRESEVKMKTKVVAPKSIYLS